MYELMIFYNKECEERIYLDSQQATHRLQVETPEDLCALWSALLKTYEGATYSVWDRDDCILAGAYDPMDIGSLNDYFGETVAKQASEQGAFAKRVAAAEQILIDNGIEKDEAATVLQAIGYALLDAELYPEGKISFPAKTVQRQPVTLGEYMDINQNDIDVCLVDKDTAERLMDCVCYLDEEEQKDPEWGYTPLENWLRSLPLSHVQDWNGCPLAVVNTEYSVDQTDFLLGYSEEGFETLEWSNLSRRAEAAEADFEQRLAFLENGTPFERPFDALNMDAETPAQRKELCQFLAERENALVCEDDLVREGETVLFVYSFTTHENGRMSLVVCDVFARETEPGKGLASTIEGKIQLAKCKQNAASQGISAEKQHPNRA